ncbi:uncharacterized protein FFNC_08865 [Fusarium fujikuroi]|nr:uncharacterized protein FFC1_13122 [Fusarium fujikuroi]SCO43236.1 uncharacterized protein FFNC_08865 [Fusarium fujikuroi]SCV45743.1 uncharacterized protein FFFS_07429 [Fusarium fujikuroi]
MGLFTWPTRTLWNVHRMQAVQQRRPGYPVIPSNPGTPMWREGASRHLDYQASDKFIRAQRSDCLYLRTVTFPAS